MITRDLEATLSQILLETNSSVSNSVKEIDDDDEHDDHDITGFAAKIV